MAERNLTNMNINGNSKTVVLQSKNAQHSFWDEYYLSASLKDAPLSGHPKHHRELAIDRTKNRKKKI